MRAVDMGLPSRARCHRGPYLARVMEGPSSRRTEDEVVAELVAVLRGLSRGTVIRWGDDGLAEGGVLTGWVDVWAPELARPLRLNWLWTVQHPGSGPEDGAPDGPLTLEVPADAVDENGESGWHPGTISAALESWVRVHAGRGDLVFAYEPDLRSDMLTEIMERDDFDAPKLEDPEEQLHEVVEVNEVLATRCGLKPGPAWRLVDGGCGSGRTGTSTISTARCRTCAPAAMTDETMAGRLVRPVAHVTSRRKQMWSDEVLDGVLDLLGPGEVVMLAGRPESGVSTTSAVWCRGGLPHGAVASWPAGNVPPSCCCASSRRFATLRSQTSWAGRSTSWRRGSSAWGYAGTCWSRSTTCSWSKVRRTSRQQPRPLPCDGASGWCWAPWPRAG